jgi:hypothetical protein
MIVDSRKEWKKRFGQILKLGRSISLDNRQRDCGKDGKEHVVVLHAFPLFMVESRRCYIGDDDRHCSLLLKHERNAMYTSVCTEQTVNGRLCTRLFASSFDTILPSI